MHLTHGELQAYRSEWSSVMKDEHTLGSRILNAFTRPVVAGYH